MVRLAEVYNFPQLRITYGAERRQNPWLGEDQLQAWALHSNSPEHPAPESTESAPAVVRQSRSRCLCRLRPGESVHLTQQKRLIGPRLSG
ncbi:hypothetical protein A6R68_01087 [Neotoma lepida]|uniref:Uncharacterized protein n=1 Tax=Neotoma lepida TaxID=56216 RepID=A0A1A6GVK3_NEOLE|nr:hypothetical protein A6R68_01087 [Neotoma lepida]